MKRLSKFIKNKFLFTTCLFMIYILFLDDIDIFTIVNQSRKLSHLRESKAVVGEKLDDLKATLKELKYPSALESYAREEKLFKKEGEDIFVISYE